jgi:hypothetical protein
MNDLMYHEIFALFEKTEKRSDKINVLRQHGDKNLKEFLNENYLLLPSSNPRYCY